MNREKAFDQTAWMLQTQHSHTVWQTGVRGASSKDIGEVLSIQNTSTGRPIQLTSWEKRPTYLKTDSERRPFRLSTVLVGKFPKSPCRQSL